MAVCDCAQSPHAKNCASWDAPSTGIRPWLVSAVLVTRGNVPQQIDRITATIRAAGITDIVVWDNSERADVSCYGRYLGIGEARNPWIYQQDDDLLAPVAAILRRVDPVRDRWTVVANNRVDEAWPLTAMGVVFHRSLIAGCFDAYVAAHGYDNDFLRCSDVVFAYTNAYRRINVGYENLPTAADPTCSMYLEAGHMEVRERARERTLALC